MKNTFPENLPLGGFAEERFGTGKVPLEANIVSRYPGKANNSLLLSIDTLFPGELANRLPDSIIAASHTHFAPMIDSKKHKIGRFSNVALEIILNSLSITDLEPSEVDNVQVFRSFVDTPIYRRFDYPFARYKKSISKLGFMYPNETLKIDKSIIYFVFCLRDDAKFCLVYHANHPVARQNRSAYSADFIGALRAGMRKQLGNIPILFLQGCSADIRPRVISKRIKYLPKLYLNKRFKKIISAAEEEKIDDAYFASFECAQYESSTQLNEESFSIQQKNITVTGLGDVSSKVLYIHDDLSFHFLPFEVSHLFHLTDTNSTNYIVGCAGDTFGYLMHPSQLPFGGYEVDGSRSTMGLNKQISWNYEKRKN